MKNYLVEQPVYTKHRPAVQKFPTRRAIVHSLDHQHQSDLCDMRSFVAQNDGFNYIMTIIDVLSKYAWAAPIKRKTGYFITETITETFERNFQTRKPKLLHTDLGSEFIIKKTQN